MLLTPSTDLCPSIKNGTSKWNRMPCDDTDEDDVGCEQNEPMHLRVTVTEHTAKQPLNELLQLSKFELPAFCSRLSGEFSPYDTTDYHSCKILIHSLRQCSVFFCAVSRLLVSLVVFSICIRYLMDLFWLLLCQKLQTIEPLEDWLWAEFIPFVPSDQEYCFNTVPLLY